MLVGLSWVLFFFEININACFICVLVYQFTSVIKHERVVSVFVCALAPKWIFILYHGARAAREAI